MANKFWGRLANALVPGSVYNSHTGQWAPSGVIGGRIAAGAAGKLMGPAGSLAGMVANNYIGNTDQGFAFDQGIEGWQGFHDDMTAPREQPQSSLQVSPLEPNIQPGSYGGLYSGGGNSNFGGGLNFSPVGQGQLMGQAGIPTQTTDYGATLPDFSAYQPQQPAASSGIHSGGGGGGGGMGGGGGHRGGTRGMGSGGVSRVGGGSLPTGSKIVRRWGHLT